MIKSPYTHSGHYKPTVRQHRGGLGAWALARFRDAVEARDGIETTTVRGSPRGPAGGDTDAA